MEAIGTDQEMGFDLVPLGGDRAGAFAGEVHAVDFRQEPDVDTCVTRALGQKVDQIGAVDEVPAKVGAQAGEVEAEHTGTVEAVAEFDRFGPRADGGKVEAERMQDGGTVGADLQASAHLADRVGLFEKRDGGAAQGKRAGKRKACHPCPEDGDG